MIVDKELITQNRLIQIMDQHKLTRKKVAEILDVSPETVKAWLANIDTTKFRRMPGHRIETLLSCLNAP